ncbi:hypothetical protein EXIGLDRAFT_744017 [Exidia glandulosa HHB12029]|uniref:RlpA-like protein double-psi beta-barrel domain-containing protein n=1 Tax=Exidia glandulosa HHB12029 TaxID=1314781 RepID=A0A165QIB4_EXIGL|nr:hypothetical protein EXIGLDRAFT_744017 [Exidia glandulosa HHB12029]
MSPFTLLVALFACILAVCAVAIPANGTLDASDALEKRVTHSGRATWFEAGLGACGKQNKGSDMIVAISHLRWGSGGNCDQWMKITANGKTAYALTRDECMGCAIDAIDLSEAAFTHFFPTSKGVFTASWQFMAKGWHP